MAGIPVRPVAGLLINGGATQTLSPYVTLSLTATDTAWGVADMQFSNDAADWSAWQAFAPTASSG